MYAELTPDNLSEYGHNRGCGNLLGLQPCVTARDYASASTLTARLDGYLEAAAQRGWLNARTIVVVPEYLGTWLAATGESDRVYRASTRTGAMASLIARHPLRFAAALLRTPERDRAAAGLFRMQAERMAAAYQAVFSHLARERRVTLVAGSTILPAPEVREGVVRAGRGRVESALAVFGPDGRACSPLVRKVVTTDEEKPFATGAPLDSLPAFDTPAGRLGVLICADAWYPAGYARLKQQNVEFVVVPAAILNAGLWSRPWGGYNGAATPPDVDPADVGVLTEGQAVHKYTLPRRIHEAGARAGVYVFLRGRIWDTGTDGYSFAVADGRVVMEAHTDGAALLNLWL
jgi:predicted amidohydrolase